MVEPAPPPPVEDEPPAAPNDEPDAPVPPGRVIKQEVPQPSVRDPKQAWVAYAHTKGVNVDGMTKQQIIDRFRD